MIFGDFASKIKATGKRNGSFLALILNVSDCKFTRFQMLETTFGVSRVRRSGIRVQSGAENFIRTYGQARYVRNCLGVTPTIL